MLTLDAVRNKVVEKAIITNRFNGIPYPVQEIKRDRNTNTTDVTKTNKKYVECQYDNFFPADCHNAILKQSQHKSRRLLVTKSRGIKHGIENNNRSTVLERSEINNWGAGANEPV